MILLIEPGDTLIIGGDEDCGLAIIPQNYMPGFFPPSVLVDKEDAE